MKKLYSSRALCLQRRLRSVCARRQSDLSLTFPPKETLDHWLPIERPSKTLMRRLISIFDGRTPGGGGTMIFHTYGGSGHFLGSQFRISIFLGVFRKMNIFWGMTILWIFFGGSSQIGLYLGGQFYAF